jgi:nitrite reductase (NO-forming)
MTERRLPIVEQAPASGACCDACAAEPATAGPATVFAGPDRRATVATQPQFVVLEPDAGRSISRTADRRLTLAGLLVSAGFLAAAVAAALLPESVRRGVWLPVHLALAGAAGTAVASVLPFFVASLSVAPPMGRIVRGGAIGLIAGGAAAASLGVAGEVGPLAIAGAFAYLAGLGGVAVAAFWPLRFSRGRRRRLVVAAYGAAIAQVAIGVGLVIAMLGGVPPVVEGWAILKPAHAWLNVFGFLSVVIAATLVHLAPTVAGTRIVPRRSAQVALAGLVTGAPLIALGLALGDHLVARIGALAELLGAIALMGHALAVRHDRGTWTTDPDWHRLTSWSLFAAPAWFLVAVAVAAGRILWLGAVPHTWSLGSIAAPLAVGWVLQVLIGAWSQLLPSIGPGDMVAHAHQRARLGRAARARVGVLNVGVVLVTLGGALAWTAAVASGLIICGGMILASAAIFADAARSGRVSGVSRSPVTAHSGG